jgi:hypothetical protein
MLRLPICSERSHEREAGRGHVVREMHREPVVDAHCREAADEIVRLRSRLAQAREALIDAEDRLSGVLEGRYPNACEAALAFIRATLATIPATTESRDG